MKKILCLITVLLLLSFTGCKKEEVTYTLPVFETTDIHGYIMDISSGDSNSYEYRLAYIAQIINNLRKESDILLLDGGDCYQGNVLSNSLEGQPLKAYYDVMDYDGVALGNHEFDWGVTSVISSEGTIGEYELNDEFKGNCDTPFLCWNIYDKESGEKVNFTNDYVIVEKEAKALDGSKKNVKIAVFGYVADYSSMISSKLIAPYEIRESDINDIELKASELEKNGEVDASVIICHTGPEAMNELMVENSVIDLVLCGHTHVCDKGTFEDGVPYIIGGCYSQSYASANLNFKGNEVSVDNTSYTYITDDRSKLYDNNENKDLLDEDIKEISYVAAEKLEEVKPSALTKLAIIEQSVSKTDFESDNSDNIATYWIAEIFAKLAGTDVGMSNSSGVRDGIYIRDGETSRYITGSDIYTMLPFGNTIQLFELTYEDLLYIEQNSYAFGKPGGFITSGVKVTYDKNKNVTKMYFNDELIYDNGFVANKNTKFTLATQNYIAQLDMLKDKKPYKVLDGTDAEEVIKYLQENYGENKTIEVNTEQHVFVEN